MTQAGIYRILHVASGRAYVGQSANIEKRWREHRSALSNDRHHSRHFQRTWNKYGSAEFVWEVLEECSLDRLTEREQWHMDHQDKLFNSAPAAGSMLGFKHSEATRLKASAARKGYKHSPESRAKISAGNKGKQVSAEAKAKISAANKGRVKSPATKAKLAAAATGRIHSPETRAKRSQSLKGRVFSPETLAKFSAAWTDERRTALVESITHCPQGHEYNLENTYRSAKNPDNRKCITCITDRTRERRQRAKDVLTQQGHNWALSSSNTSGYRGVSWNKQRGKWRAEIMVDGKHLHLGFFADPIEAARAYDAAALIHHGEFAVLNFPQAKVAA